MQKIIYTFLASTLILLVSTGIAQAESLTADEIVSNCYVKDWGKDQKSHIHYTVTNKNGRQTKRREFIRFWKGYYGENDLLSKLMLFTVFPKPPENPSYLRWNYTHASGKVPYQWLYQPRFHTTTRVSGQTPEDLTWRTIAEDIQFEELYRFDHTLVTEEQEQEAKQTLYHVESVPKDEDSFYSKLVSHYFKGEVADDCVISSMDYYGRNGNRMKTAKYTWDKMDGVWVWKTVEIDNVKPDVIFFYENKNIEVNIGQKDSDFSKRTIQKMVR